MSAWHALLVVATVQAAVVLEGQHLSTSAAARPAAKDAAAQACRLWGGGKTQITYAMLKPDVASDEAIVKDIKERIAAAGLTIVREEQSQLSLAQCEEFYSEHRSVVEPAGPGAQFESALAPALRERDFFGDLCKFMSSGPVVKLELHGEVLRTTPRALPRPPALSV